MSDEKENKNVLGYGETEEKMTSGCLQAVFFFIGFLVLLLVIGTIIS